MNYSLYNKTYINVEDIGYNQNRSIKSSNCYIGIAIPVPGQPEPEFFTYILNSVSQNLYMNPETRPELEMYRKLNKFMTGRVIN